MSKLRSVAVWSILITQIWTPVLAQTLPIAVDKSVAGARPIIGVSNGVPVVNIAPPSAGGVSNNRYTQFNVGPSGVVLNNSGGGSQTQLAGQVAGNPMLGNQRAMAILNQVTAPNPSQLMGMLEVAGNRANVIVANPAGITCNGCGFLNADRATLTTGRPVIGADGMLSFDIAAGRLGIEGQGLYGANLSQLDLLARTLEINAQVWADRLTLVAGASRVGYDGLNVSALTGDGAAPRVALDVAALGGMYANSIRLIGTEAGVGVNVGGNLAALTGTLQLSANGDVSIQPSGRLQAATALSVDSKGQVSNAGTLAAGAGLDLRADGNVVNSGGMSAAGNVAINGRQLNNSGNVTAGLQADGSISSLGALNAQVDALLNPGTLVAGGNVNVTAGAMSLSGGKLVAGNALTLDASGNISNRGGAVYGGSVALRAAGVDNASGKITSGGALTGNVAGAIDNRGGTVAATQAVDLRAQSFGNTAGGVVSGDNVALQASGGINNQGGTLQANGKLDVNSAGALNNQDGNLLGGAAEIRAGSLNNQNGVVQADGKLDVASVGVLINQGGGFYGGSADIKMASLANTGGKIVSGDALNLTATGHIDNVGGTVAAQGLVTLNAQSLANTRGIVAGNGITLKALGALDNSAGLIQADDVLALTAASVNNRDTLANSASGALGLMGKQVTLNAAAVDNQAGRIGAGQDLGVTTGTLNNNSGNVSSNANAKLAVGNLQNTSGALTAGASLELTTGNLDNTGKIHSGQHLTINADTLTNRAAGEIIAAGNNFLNVGGTLANAGLIDGGYTRIDAGNVTNTGRIYGDRVGIKTPTLLNDANAVIASRGDMDLGVGSLVNREHALIYSAGDLRIGGALDVTGKAAGLAQSIVNVSATIEVAGNADIAAASIQNLNQHFTSEVVEVSRGPKLYYRLENSTELLDGSKLWLCDQVTALCGRDPVTFLDDDAERRLLLPSTTYPESIFGPPFDYVASRRGEAGFSAPIPLAYMPGPVAGSEGCGSGEYGKFCMLEPEVYRYSQEARIWAIFEVAQPSGPLPEWVPLDTPCSTIASCAAEKERRDAFDLELSAFKNAHRALNEKIRAFNADFNSRLVANFFYYKVDEVITESRTLSTDPAKIIVGGNAKFTGAVTNDKSRIIAGGVLSVDGPAVTNLGAEGQRTLERVGYQVRTITSGGGRKENRTDYTDVVAPERIELAVASSTGNTAPPATGNQKPGSTAVAGALAPAKIIEIGLPGKGIVRVVTLPPVIPKSALFQVLHRPDAPYLIATDAQFLGQRPVLSSDYLLQQLNQNPGHILKRLGDGFYEQKLVAEQVMLATGQRFVGDYTDNESQYKALLTAGADFAGKFGLTIGTALTEEQMRHLTSDIVWMVEQTVTLPDGTQQTVLSPQVYLAVQPGDLRGDGTLIAGRDTRIKTAGDVTNTGTIGARNALLVEAENVRNTVGSMQGKTVNLAARNDIDNLAGLLKGDSVTLAAGRDINLTASTQSNASGGVSSTRVGGVARIDAGSLNAQAGRDFNAQAAAISATADARVQAGRDINLTTAEDRYAESYDYGKKNRAEMRSSTDVGTQIAAGGNLTLIAGQDVNAIAAQVSSDKQLAVGAGRDINVLAGDSAGYAYNETYVKKKGFLSSTSTHRKNETDWTQAVSSTFTGDSAVLMAGRDLNVAGSNVAAENDLVISADRNVNIVAEQNKSDDYQYEKVKKSGFGALGGFSYGSRQTTDWVDTERGLNTGSTIGSVQGDVLINAGGSLNVLGSDILARQGDITLIGRDVSIVGGADTMRQREVHEVKQSGVTVTASNPVVSAMQTGGRMAEAAGKSGNAVMTGLAGATTALAASNAYDAVKAAGAVKDASAIQKAGGVSIKLSLGSSKSSSTTDRNSTTTVGSNIAAGNDLTIVAQGAGKNSGITVTGSNLSAGNNAVLKAEGDIVLQAARNVFEQKTESKSSSASIGIGYSTGEQNGFTLELGASVGRGNANGNDVSWTNSNITAGNVLALQSGGDTTLKGASGKAEQIIASVGGNLLLESLQDSSKYDSKNKSAGFGVVLCIPPYCVGSSSVSANASTGKMNSNFKSVTEQTGLWAGDGGFLIDVKNNTTLIGSVIASSDKAVADGLNKLTTGTLVTEDIKNTAKYSASQVSVGGGFGFGGGSAKAGDAGLGTTKDGQVAGGATKEAGSSISTGSSGFGMGTPVVVAASGNSSSTTNSAISGGTIVIRDEAGQLALTGKTAEETIASLNRDTSDTLNALKPIFDKEKIEAGFEIASEASKQMGQFLTNRAKEVDAARERSEDPSLTDAERLQGLKDYTELNSKWGTGGDYRRWSTAILGAALGNVTGATSEFVQSAAVNYLQSLGAEQIKALSKDLGGDGSVGNSALHTILGCAGASGRGASCAAGGIGALSSVVVNKLLDGLREDAIKGLSAEDREARLNLVDSIVAGIAAAVDPSAAATAQLSAHIEGENNYLSNEQNAKRNQEILACDSWTCAVKVKVKWAAIDAGQDVSFATGMVAGVPASLYDSVVGIAGIAASPLETYAALKSLFESDDVFGTVSDAVKQSYIQRIELLEQDYQRAGAGGSFNAGVEFGKLVFEAVSLVAVGGGGANAGINLSQKVAAKVASNSVKAEKSLAGQVGKGTAEIPASSAIAREGLYNDLLIAQKNDQLLGSTLPGGKAPVTVTAEGSVGGKVLVDTNQSARPALAADPNKPTLIADLILPGQPNSTMANAHAEIAIIQRAFDSGLTRGESMSIVVRGEAICSYCQSSNNIMAAAEKAGLNRLILIEAESGISFSWIRGTNEWLMGGK